VSLDCSLPAVHSNRCNYPREDPSAYESLYRLRNNQAAFR